MAHRLSTTRSILAVAIGASLPCAAIADPPPFLPPSLQRVVKEAQEQRALSEPRARNADIEDLRAVSEGDLTLGEVIDQLGADDLATRERASAVLADVAMWDEETLAAACLLPDLCPETRERLRAAMFGRFLNAPKPAIGISMKQASRSGIGIEAVQAGFPSNEVLRADDEILKIGDIDFRPNPRDTILLQTTIASYDPGEVVEMLLLRGNAEITAQVKLGAFSELGPAAGGRSVSLYRRAFDIRLQRKGIDLGADQPLAAPISRIDWDRAGRRPVRQSEAADLLAGGAPYAVPGRPSGGLRPGDSIRAVRSERARDEVKNALDNEAAQGVKVQLQNLDREIESIREKLTDPRLSREDQAALSVQMSQIARTRQILLDALINR